MLESIPMSQERHSAYADSLGKAERVLVVLRDELYGGSWDELVDDLRARRERKPAIFKLNSRIDEDLARIEKLRAYEEQEGVDLATLLRPGDGSEETIPL
jgi:hypothetical protein